MRRFLAVFALLAIAGCSTGGMSSLAQSDPIAAFKGEIRAYWFCGMEEADRMARRSNEETKYIVVAARQKCLAHRQAVIEKIMATTPPRMWETHQRELDNGFDDLVIGRVVEAR